MQLSCFVLITGVISQYKIGMWFKLQIIHLSNKPLAIMCQQLSSVIPQHSEGTSSMNPQLRGGLRTIPDESINSLSVSCREISRQSMVLSHLTSRRVYLLLLRGLAPVQRTIILVCNEYLTIYRSLAYVAEGNNFVLWW